MSEKTRGEISPPALLRAQVHLASRASPRAGHQLSCHHIPLGSEAQMLQASASDVSAFDLRSGPRMARHCQNIGNFRRDIGIDRCQSHSIRRQTRAIRKRDFTDDTGQTAEHYVETPTAYRRLNLKLSSSVRK